ncbi:MAG: hypothetical protein AB1634_14625 [Thermodesulfobacteriota bacterium]
MRRALAISMISLACLATDRSAAQAWSFDIAQGPTPLSYEIKYDTNDATPETITLDMYSLVINYAGANVTGAVETPPPPLTDIMGPYVDDGSQLTITGGSLLPVSAVLAADYTFATFTFDRRPTLSWAGDSVNFLAIVNGEEFGNSGFGFPVSDLRLTNTAAVPLPGTAWQLGAGALALLSLRRRLAIA